MRVEVEETKRDNLRDREAFSAVAPSHMHSPADPRSGRTKRRDFSSVSKLRRPSPSLPEGNGPRVLSNHEQVWDSGDGAGRSREGVRRAHVSMWNHVLTEHQTTFCAALIQHLKNNRRSCFYVNLDPAADVFAYEPDVDIKDLISLEDVMEEMGLGPNGGLIYCFE